MKKIKNIICAVFLMGICLTVFSSVPNADAATNGAGSQNDPVVTLSYLEYRLDKLQKGEKVSSGDSRADGNTDGKSITNDGGFQRIVLQKGEKLTPDIGSCMVLYSGNAKVIGDAGLVNLTEGTLYPKECSLSMYCQYLVAEKGSGIEASGSCIVFVR